MKLGMLVTFLVTLGLGVYFHIYYTNMELDAPFYVGIIKAGSIVSGIIFFSILFSKAESDDFDGDGQ